MRSGFGRSRLQTAVNGSGDRALKPASADPTAAVGTAGRPSGEMVDPAVIQKKIVDMEAMRVHMEALATDRARQAEQFAQLTAGRDRWGHAAQEATKIAGATAPDANPELARLQARIIDMQDQ